MATDFDHAAFAQDLTAWFQKAQRDLPWRHAENARDAYRVLVSEVMLQQTTVAAVVPFYQRFLARFPTLKSLADASLDEVLPFWAGLGYYSRARNLHACAQAVMKNYNGIFPRDLDDVLALPGIGRYTAGAVTSIAFNLPSPIVDANVARVLARIFCIEGDVKSGAVQKRLWHEAAQIVQRGAAQNLAPSQLNPALMELGALVCTPREPLCGVCPVARFCTARDRNRQHELPQFAPKRAPVELHDVCAFIVQSTCREKETGVSPASTLHGEKRVLLRQLPHEKNVWWRGMWELPRTTIGPQENAESALRRVLCEELKRPILAVGPLLQTMKHGVTHHKITLDCYAVEIEGSEDTAAARWFSREESEALAMPSVMRRLLRRFAPTPADDLQNSEAQLKLL